MEVIPGSSGSMPFQRHNVEEWSHLDSLTGMLEHARVETDHWSANTSNTSHKYGKVVDSRARNLADGSVQQRQRKQLEVFQAQVPGGSLQVIRTQSVTSTSSSRTIHNNISADFENLKLSLNPLDLSTQKTKATVGRSGSIGSRRPPSRPRSIINKVDSSISEENSSLFSTDKQNVDDRLSEVSRLCQQIHEETKKNVSNSFSKISTSPFTNTSTISDSGSHFLTDERKSGKFLSDREDKSSSSVRIANKSEETVSNGHVHSLLIRKKSCSTEDLQKIDQDDNEKSGDEKDLADWKRSAKVRRSLQFPSKGNYFDIIPNGNVSKICKGIEDSKKDNIMKNTVCNVEALENALRNGSLNKSNLLKENNIHTYNNNLIGKTENEAESFTRRVSSSKIPAHKRHSFVTVESLKEVRGRLRRLSSPPLDGFQHNTHSKSADDSDDGIETEESNKAVPTMNPKTTVNNAISNMKTYVYGMDSQNNNARSIVRKPIPGTGSLESRTSNRSSSSNGSRTEEWYNRRKSYGFEQVHGQQNGNQSSSITFQEKNKVESSTDSGICRSSETVGASSWSQLFGRPKDEAGNIKISHSIQIKKFGYERDSSDSDSRGTQKGRRTVVTLGNDDEMKINNSLRETAFAKSDKWNSNSSYTNDNSIRCLSEPVTVSIPVILDDSSNNAETNGNVESKRHFFRQLEEGTTLTAQDTRRRSGSFLENGCSDKNLSDETKTLAARRELLMKHRESGSRFKSWNADSGWSYPSKSTDGEVKRHSIAVDESKYVRNATENYNGKKGGYLNFDSGFNTSSKSISDFEKCNGISSTNKISIDFRSTSTLEEEDQQLAGKKQKKVEFSKTEVHFAAEPGRFNIVETDEKPPPTNMFRRRRRNSASNLISNQTQEANRNSLPVIHFGDSPYEKKLLSGNEPDSQTAPSKENESTPPLILKRAEIMTTGFQDDADKEDIIYTQANPTILASVRQEASELTVHDDAEEVCEDTTALQNLLDTAKPRSILKNHRKPRPFHLGETEDNSFLSNVNDSSSEPETRWGVKLKPVQNKEPSMWRSTVTLQNSSFDSPKEPVNQLEERYQKRQRNFTYDEKFPKELQNFPQHDDRFTNKNFSSYEEKFPKQLHDFPQNNEKFNKQQNLIQQEEKFPKQVTSQGIQSYHDESELQKLLKSLKPAAQRKSTGNIFSPSEPVENGIEIKISSPSPIQPASWSVADRVRQVEDWKHASLEPKGYSTRVNFGAGEATIVENGMSDNQQRHSLPSTTLYQPNSRPKPIWLRREERKLEANDTNRQTASDKGLIVHIGKSEDYNIKGDISSRTSDSSHMKKTTTITIDLSPSPSDKKSFQRVCDKREERMKPNRMTSSGTGSLRSPSLIMKTISKSSLVQETGSEDDTTSSDNSYRNSKYSSEDSSNNHNHNETESDTSGGNGHSRKVTKTRTEDNIIGPNQLAALKELYDNAELSDDSERADEEVRSYMSGGGDEDDRDRDEDVSSVVSGSWSRMRAFRNIQQHFNKFAQNQKGSSPIKMKDCRDATFQRSIATANLQSYDDPNSLRSVETLVSTRSGHPRITSISLKYDGDQSSSSRHLEYISPNSKNSNNRHSDYAKQNSNINNSNFLNTNTYSKNDLHISEPILSPSYKTNLGMLNTQSEKSITSNISDYKQRASKKESVFSTKTKEISPAHQIEPSRKELAEERNYENINPRLLEKNKSDSSVKVDKRDVSCPDYQNTVSLFGKDNNLSTKPISVDQKASKHSYRSSALTTNTGTYTKEQGRRPVSSSIASQQQKLSSLFISESSSKPSDHTFIKKESTNDNRRPSPEKEVSKKTNIMPEKSSSSGSGSFTRDTKNSQNVVNAIQHRERERRSSRTSGSSASPKRDRSLSPSKSVPKPSSVETPNKEDSESHIYENILSPLKLGRSDGVETESVILEELTKAADQILQAVNGYTDEDSYRASSDDDDDDSIRGSGRRRGKRYQVRKVSGSLGTITEAPSLKRQSDAGSRNSNQAIKNNDNRKNQRLQKSRLGPTSSTSSIESFTKEITRTSANHTNDRSKSKSSTGSGAVKSSGRSARLLQRASSRELLLQAYGSSSEDGGSVRKPVLPRRTRSHNIATSINKTDSVTTNLKKISVSSDSQHSPIAKPRQRKKDADVTKPKERFPGSTSKQAPLSRKMSGGDPVSKSRTSRSREEEAYRRGSSRPTTRRDHTESRHRAQGGSAAVELTGHEKTERGAMSDRRMMGTTKSPASCVVTKKKPALASSHNGSPQTKATK